MQPGTYNENINFRGKNIVVGSLFVTTGDQGYIAQTVINGNRAGRVVTFENGETASAVLSGLTLTNGYVQGAGTAGSGGGIACFNANPTLKHLIVSNNEATGEGGGLYFSTCSASLQDSRIVGNKADNGGGIRYSYGNPMLDNVVVYANTANTGGGGIFFYHAEASVKNALIANNAALDPLHGDRGGAGLYFDGCSPTIVNTTIAGNSTLGGGGGLHVSYMSQPSLVNSIVWGNSPEEIYFNTRWGGMGISIASSDIQGGAAGIVTNGQGVVNWGDGNMDTSPQFVSAGGADFHLADDSPCINAGQAADAPVADIEGHPRPNPAGSRPDMGAYENPLGMPVNQVNVITITTVQELQAMKNNLSGHYALANDLDCAGIANFEPIGKPGSPFVGTFTGNGHTIRHLTINRPGEDYVGLFGNIQHANIANIALSDVQITGRSNVGSLVGYLQESAVSMASVTGVVTGTGAHIGGLIGESYNGNGIGHCQVEVTVNAQNASEVGGFIGRIWDGNINHITDSFYRGSVNAPGSNSVGGFAGYSKSGDFIRCFVNGSVIGNNQVGGIVGFATENGGIYNSYAQAAVTGKADVGGLAGSFNSYDDGASRSYYAGVITGTSTVGGLFGRYSAGALTNNFWDYELARLPSGQDTGNNGDINGIDGRTTAAMMRQDTFTGWDFSTIWTMIDYPHLQFEPKATQPVLSIQPPATVVVGDVVYIPVKLSQVNRAQDLRGVQFSLRATATAILTPAINTAPLPGDLFPPSSITSTTLASGGWDFLLTDSVSNPAVSGGGVVVNLPFLAHSAGCLTLTFADHELSNGSAQAIPHTAGTAPLCIVSKGAVQGNLYLDWRSSGHYTHTQVVLIGPRQTYTTSTDPAGNFALTNLVADSYTLQTSHPLFVRAQRTVTVTAALTTTVPKLGLWAGDINQDQKVTWYDWFLLAAAIFPVSDPHFDINDDGTTNIQDLVILSRNLNQPNMTTSNPPSRPGLASLDLDQPKLTVQTSGSLKLVATGDHEMALRLEVEGQPIHAVGTRLALPAGATVTEVVPGPAFSGGYLQWHQEGATLYLVVAPPEEQVITQNAEVVILRGVTFVEGETVVEAENSVLDLKNNVFLPLIIK